MFYAIGRFELLIAASHSLKEKRAVLQSAKARLEHRFRLSVAEVEHQDLHQRGALGVALVVSSESRGRDALAAVRREIETDPRLVVVDARRRVERFDDPRGTDEDDDDDDFRLEGISYEEEGEEAGAPFEEQDPEEGEERR